MKKLLFVGILGFASYPALACDWNRQASAKDPVVASTTVTTEQPQAAPASTSVASEQSVRKPVDQATPIVMVRDRQ